jgi:hypothetical protein
LRIADLAVASGISTNPDKIPGRSQGADSADNSQDQETECLAPDGFCPGEQKPTRDSPGDSDSKHRGPGGGPVIGPPAEVRQGESRSGAVPECLKAPGPCP